MHLCLQQPIPWGAGDGAAEGGLRCLLHTEPCVRSTGGSFVRVHSEDALWDGGAASPCSHPAQAPEQPGSSAAGRAAPALQCSGAERSQHRAAAHGQHGTPALPQLCCSCAPVLQEHTGCKSQGTFQRHFSNSHYPPCKDHGPAFSSAWLLFRPHFLSSVDAFFQLKEEGAWVLLGLSLAGKESTHALHVLCRLLQSLVDPFPGTRHRLCWGHSTERCHRCTGRLQRPHGAERLCHALIPSDPHPI